MSGSIDSPLAKIERAQEHYLALKQEMGSAGNLQECPVIVKHTKDCLEYTFHSLVGKEIDAEWSLIIGDCLFNLRAALDHLVYQLHVRRFRGSVPGKVEKISAFPIHKTVQGLSYPWDSIKNLSKEQQRKIKYLQPYVNLNRKDKLYYVRRALGAIHELNRVDKHRRILVAWQTIGATTVPHFAPEYGFKRETYFGCQLQPQMIVERWTFTKPYPNIGDDQALFTEVVMEEPSCGYVAVLPFMKAMINNTKVVIDRFKKYF